MMASRNSGFASKLTLAAGLLLAGAAMALSSFTVVSNANRLRGFQPKGAPA